MSEQISFSTCVREGLRAGKANLGYGLALQAVALCLVLGYYYVPSMRETLQALSDFRQRVGLPSSMVSTAICGGLIPYLMLRLFAPPAMRQTWRMGLLASAFWAYKGIEVDIWYRVLEAIFGPDADVATVAYKTLADQLFYCPTIAIPLTVLVYSLGQADFSIRRVVNDLKSPGWYSRRVLTPLISNAGVWFPACAIIYSLPTPLQLPLQNLVLVFFTLILAHLTAKSLEPRQTEKSKA